MHFDWGEWEKIMAMKREDSSKQKSAGRYIPCKDPFFDGLPLLEQLVGDRWWEDGKPRVPCNIRITLLGDGVQLSIIDEEGRRSAHTVGRTVQDAARLLEAYLASGGMPWRPWGPERKK